MVGELGLAAVVQPARAVSRIVAVVTAASDGFIPQWCAFGSSGIQALAEEGE
jgi:hypothetical protein